MWNIDEIEIVPQVLDMSSSEQGHYPVNAIKNAGTPLFNALELFKFDAEASQVDICAECGTTHCQSGGWVAFRRVEDRVVWIPAWPLMLGEMGNEYRPPDFFLSKGAPVFSQSVWEKIRHLAKNLPPAKELPILNSQELVRLLQHSAPGRVLGQFPESAALRRELIAAVKEGSEPKLADEIDAALALWTDRKMPLTIVSDIKMSTPITLWLELPGTPEWACIWHGADGALQLGDGHVMLQPLADTENE